MTVTTKDPNKVEFPVSLKGINNPHDWSAIEAYHEEQNIQWAFRQSVSSDDRTYTFLFDKLTDATAFKLAFADRLAGKGGSSNV